MQTLGKQKVVKSRKQIYICNFCHYSTSRKLDYEKHILTDKHQKLTSAYNCKPKCACGQIFNHRQSLYRHKKTCFVEENSTAKDEKVVNSLPKVCHLYECVCGRAYKHACSLSKHRKSCLHYSKEQNATIGGNSEVEQTCEDNKLLKEKITELESGVMTAVSEPKTVNNYNNIVFLLNEKCSDAIAISDFAKQIVMQIEDVDYAMENGKVRGIENIINNEELYMLKMKRVGKKRRAR